MGLQAETCVRDLQNQINETDYAEGYIYLEGTEEISQQQLDSIQRACQLSNHSKIMSCTTKMFQSVSFCDSNITSHKSVGDLRFPKTNIGTIASSKEVCPGSQKPLATMFCKGDFIRPSYWDVLTVNNCTEYVDIDLTHNPITTEKTIMESNSLTIKSLPDERPTLSTIEDIDRVTKTRSRTGLEPDHISKATTMSGETINDDIRVTKENLNEVSTIKDVDQVTETRLHTSPEPDHISEATTMPSGNNNDDIRVTKENLNEESTIKDIDQVTETRLHTSPEPDHITEATTVYGETINYDIRVTKENLNEVSTIKDIDQVTKTRFHTSPKPDHITEATTMSGETINDDVRVTKVNVNEVSTIKDIDQVTETRFRTSPEPDHISEGTTMSGETIIDDIRVTKENVNEVSTIKDIDQVTETRLHTSPEPDHISEATTMSGETINDDIRVTKENVNEVSTIKDIDQVTETRFRTSPEPDHISEGTTMSGETIIDDIRVTEENLNEVSTIKDIDQVTKTRFHTSPEPDHITEATTMSGETINDDIRVTKENVNEVSTIKDIDQVTETRFHTSPEPDHISEATPMSGETIIDDIRVTKENLNEVSTIKDIDQVTETRLNSSPEPDHISEATPMSGETIIDDIRVTKENVNEISRLLSESTENPENVDEVNVVKLSEILMNISEIGSSSHEVTRNVLEIVDNLLNVKEHVYEESIFRGACSRILQALETQMTNLHKRETNFTAVKSSLGVAARQLERSAFLENVTFGGFTSIGSVDATYHLNESEVSVMAGNDKNLSKFLATITLPASLLDEISTGHNGKIPLTFIIHRTSLLFMSSNSRQRRHSERVESLVIAATVEGHTMANLSSPVISRFQLPHHADGPMTKHSKKCVFWDYTLANGHGDWSSEGCETVSGSEENNGLIIECHCSHLTNFAVLLDVQGDIDHIALDILSITGCVVSIFALVITLIVLLGVKKLREQVPQKIIINLCLALLGLYICFLSGIDQSSLGIGCVIFGALIHYFCVASVAWMCVVATNMYILFVRVFNADVTSFMWKAYLAAWGLPMIVVFVSVILEHQNYTSSYCFPQNGTMTFYLGVLLLIGLMLCYNLVIFILIVRQVTCGRIGRPAGQDKRTEMFERTQSIIIISVLLGLTWVFGFLSIGSARFTFNLLFLIFNSLQGFFVFVFFILRPKNVRMILFKYCYRCQDGNVGSYTVNKSQTDGTNDQKDTLDMDVVVVTRSDSHSL
ncbi:Adhesion G-protein coupled receptor G4 [Holothuria leucospilota]|uniref:Adhesion G-protein coupled receptor G4 n=1 Tax=Holothuria leucospilota TaxID=206669 RepID=A0A9Q1BGD4_HOLLE|nr:Adhesion G-protein coupled receptor G4 [Holothuria leucospilota]